MKRKLLVNSKEWRKTVTGLAQLRMITLVCRDLKLPLGKDSTADRAKIRAEWKKLRFFHCKADQPKLRKLVDLMAREMMSPSN